MKVGVVQRVHVGAKGLSQGVRQFVLVFDGRNRVQMRLQRRQPLGFNARFVHVRVVRSAILRLSEPAGAFCLAASSMIAAVRLFVRSESAVNTPTRERSGGITVRLIHWPLAYWKKSSPGWTVGSILAIAMPWISLVAVCAWAKMSVRGKSIAHAAARAKVRFLWLNF